MSQSSHSVGNVSAPAFRTAMNASLQALASLNSGATAPATTYANMLWYDTAANILKMRSEADDAWINVAYVDQSANAWRVLDDTQVVNTSGTQTGLLGAQTTAAFEAGTSTTESLVSPAKVKAAVEALVPIDRPAIKLLSRSVISGSPAVVDFSFDSSEYDEVFFVFSGIRPAENQRRLECRTSTDSGVSFSSGASDYNWVTFAQSLTGNNFEEASGDDIIELLSTSVLNGTFDGGIAGTVYLYNALTPRIKSSFSFNRLVLEQGTGMRVAVQTVNAIRFFFSSGNFANSGSIAMYGVRKT